MIRCRKPKNTKYIILNATEISRADSEMVDRFDKTKISPIMNPGLSKSSSRKLSVLSKSRYPAACWWSPCLPISVSIAPTPKVHGERGNEEGFSGILESNRQAKGSPQDPIRKNKCWILLREKVQWSGIDQIHDPNVEISRNRNIAYSWSLYTTSNRTIDANSAPGTMKTPPMISAKNNAYHSTKPLGQGCANSSNPS